MRIVLNIIWLVFGGLWLALGYFLAGVIMCILIITIPFGIAAFRMACTRCGRSAAPSSTSPPPGVGLTDRQRHLARPRRHLARDRARHHRRRHGDHDHRHPARVANLKMVPVSLMPLGKEIVDVDAVPAYPGGAQG